MSRKLLSLYGLKWNPFCPDVPTQALFVTPRTESFGFRVENQVREGGFVLVTGESGCGKSATMRITAARLSELREVKVGVLTRPQANLADFYRELGDIFGVSLRPHNRWAGGKVLRETWNAHIEASLYRPVLVIDEAQEMQTSVLSELRLLSSADLDSRSILTVILAGDGRLLGKLNTPELLPVMGRIRARLAIEAASAKELADFLKHITKAAGNPSLLTDGLISTLCEHACGNYRSLVNTANELLVSASVKEAERLDEKLFFETFALEPPRKRKSA